MLLQGSCHTRGNTNILHVRICFWVEVNINMKTALLHYCADRTILLPSETLQTTLKIKLSLKGVHGTAHQHCDFPKEKPKPHLVHQLSSCNKIHTSCTKS